MLQRVGTAAVVVVVLVSVLVGLLWAFQRRLVYLPDAGPAGPAAAILAMAAATVFCRYLGYLMMGWIPLTPRVEGALEALPGSIVAATVVPLAIQSGPAAIAGVVASVLTARLLGSELAAIAAGMAVAAGARAFGL